MTFLNVPPLPLELTRGSNYLPPWSSSAQTTAGEMQKKKGMLHKNGGDI